MPTLESLFVFDNDGRNVLADTYEKRVMFAVFARTLLDATVEVEVRGAGGACYDWFFNRGRYRDNSGTYPFGMKGMCHHLGLDFEKLSEGIEKLFNTHEPWEIRDMIVRVLRNRK